MLWTREPGQGDSAFAACERRQAARETSVWYTRPAQTVFSGFVNAYAAGFLLSGASDAPGWYRKTAVARFVRSLNCGCL